MQLTLRVHIPKGVTTKEQRLAKTIEKFVAKEIKTKFGKKVSVTNKYKSKKEPINPRKLTIQMKRELYADLINDYHKQRITILQFWIQVRTFKLYEQAHITEAGCRKQITKERKHIARRN